MAARRTKKKSKEKTKTKKRKTAPARTRKAPTKRKSAKAKRPVARKAKAKARKVAPRKAAKRTAKKRTSAKKEVFGEGNYTATRNFDKADAGFVKRNKAKVPAMGKAAKGAMDGPEGDELRAADRETASHATGHDEE